jgi:broad specificity phosphatase PhoE
MIHLYVVRHGQTILNQLGRMQGWVDSFLTKRGRDQAVSTGQALKNKSFVLVASSDLRRAQDTANIISKQLIHQPALRRSFPEFREVNFGGLDATKIKPMWQEITDDTPYHGLNDILARADFEKVRQIMQDHDPLHTAESNEDVLDRWQHGVKLINDTVESVNENTDANVLLVSHGTFIRTVAEHYGAEVAGNDHAPQNGSVTIFDLKGDQVSLKSYNQQL